MYNWNIDKKEALPFENFNEHLSMTSVSRSLGSIERGFYNINQAKRSMYANGKRSHIHKTHLYN